MATLREKADFVAALVGQAEALNKALAERQRKAELLERLVGSGLDGDRDAIRKGMTFSVERREGKGSVQSMDERGQRKSIETEDTSKYLALDPKAEKAAREALARVLKVKDEMLKEGFTNEEIITELFTPLVREGLIPENLVVDGYSEVATMLREVIKSYKEMLKKQMEEKRLADGKAVNDSLGGGTKLDVLKGMGSRAKSYAESRVSVVAGKVGMTPEEFNRARELVSKGKALVDSVGDISDATDDLSDAIDGKEKPEALKLSEKLDQLKLDNYQVSSVVEGLAGKLDAVITQGPLKAVLSQVEKALKGAAMSLDELVATKGPQVIDVLKQFAKLIESDGVTITKDVVGVLKEIGAGAKDMAESGGEKKAIEIDIQVAVRSGELRAGASDMVANAEQALKQALLPAGIPVSDLVSRGFVKAFKVDAMVELVKPALAANPKSAPTGAAVVKLVAAALSAAVEGAHASLAGFGASLSKKFIGEAGSETTRINDLLVAGQLADPAGLLPPLAKVVEKAAQTVFDDSFVEALAADGVGDSINEAATAENAKLQQIELEQANQEIDDFERELVLIDEGGMETARQESLDVLIAQLKKDELDLQIVLKAGSLLSGAGTSITESVVGKVGTKVAKKAAESVLPALQAAELVMKMSVTIVKIARRAELVRKFNADVSKARKAGSYLLPSIENFYSSKVQQQVYASIELALQVVQLAGTIAASVPEPITMAVGQLITKIAESGEAARDLAKTVHDEALLRKGWKVTLEALNNPSNRRAGLEALRRNGTLAVHSVAWAANNGDVMAREIMRSCGVNAQTLADEGTDQDKLIDYLETLLSEDLQFKDVDKLKLEWVPEPLALGYAGWFAVKNRAAKADTPWTVEATPELDKALKALDAQPTPAVLRGNLAKLTAPELQGFVNQAETVARLFGEQKPRAKGGVHAEMVEVCERLKGLADNRASQLKVLLNELELVTAP